ncbi:MAG: hypothetical protein JO041_03755 [Acidobacteria bacterium]|nr:hypothetical protein [Acidobacteriota bacterium]
MGRRNIPDALGQLRGGSRASIGNANRAAEAARRDARVFRELMKGMWSEDAVIRMRAADAAEKASRSNARLLAPFKAELLGLMREERQQEVRWHLAAMVPRLNLSRRECGAAWAAFREYLDDRSSIVRTFALQALHELALRHPPLRDETLELLQSAVRSGTPAMKARARRLLADANFTF